MKATRQTGEDKEQAETSANSVRPDKKSSTSPDEHRHADTRVGRWVNSWLDHLPDFSSYHVSHMTNAFAPVAGSQMSQLGQEIFRGYDEYGAVHVYDDGQKRYLSFGINDEQSCLLKSQPDLLQHEYTRALMSLLLLVEPRRLLMIGLGGGCLVHALLKHVPALKIEVVELRQLVIDVAREQFSLPSSRRLNVVTMDAGRYLYDQQGSADKQVDVLISDVFLSEGIDEQQMAPDYLAACAGRLKNDGWLLLNCWAIHKSYDGLIERLSEHFVDIRSLSTQSGNWLIFAGKVPCQYSQRELKQRARQWSKVLGYQISGQFKQHV